MSKLVPQPAMLRVDLESLRIKVPVDNLPEGAATSLVNDTVDVRIVEIAFPGAQTLLYLRGEVASVEPEHHHPPEPAIVELRRLRQVVDL